MRASIAARAAPAGASGGGLGVRQDPSASLLVPAQLLPPPAPFANRVEELDALDRLLQDEQAAPDRRVIVLAGPGGVGKSALALTWLHRHRERFTDGALHADLAGDVDAPASPGMVLARFLRALGVPAENVPQSLAEQTALYRTVTSGRRLLVLLETPVSAAQVRVLLPASQHSLTVITTRRRLSGLSMDGGVFIEVGPLSIGGSVELLTQLLGRRRVTAESEATRALVKMCARTPIALRAAGARLATRPRLTVERVVGQLADEHSRLAALTVGDVSLEAVFDVSYQALSPEAARLYRILGLHPGPDFTAGLAAAAAELGPDVAAGLLEELAEATLISEIDQDRFRFHDLVRLHARGKGHTDNRDEYEAVIGRLLDWYLRTAAAATLTVMPGRWHVAPVFDEVSPAAFSGTAQALDWLRHELPNAWAVVHFAHEHGWHRHAWQLCEALWALFQVERPYEAWIDTHKNGISSARTDGDTAGEARLNIQLGTAYLNLRRPDTAVECYERALDLATQAGHRLAEASALDHIGLVALRAGHPDEAITWFEHVRDIHQELGRPPGVALMIRRIGEGHRDAGRYAAATAALTEAANLFTSLSDPLNHARTTTSLAETHLRNGHSEEAIRLLEAALDNVQQLGAEHDQGRIRVALAAAAIAGGDREAARDHLRRALDIYTRGNDPAARDVAQQLATLDHPSH